MIQKLKQNMRSHWLWWALAALSIIYLVLQYNHFFNILAWADTDDALQYTLSQYLAHGHWLGPYNRFTLIKGIGFPVWTAFLHVGHIPIWLGNSLLMIFASLAIVYALRRTGLQKWALLLIFGLTLFNPMITARIYRDDIIPAITILVLAWIVGMFMSLTSWQRDKLELPRKDITIFTLIGLISLPAWYYTREDALWLLPFVLVTIAIIIAYCVYHMRRQLRQNLKVLSLVAILLIAPFIVVQAVGVGIASLNEHYYGRYVVNDYFSKDFENAYAALSRVDTTQPKLLSIPVSYDMRQKLYKVSPAFAALQPCLDGTNAPGLCEGFKETGPNKAAHDYEGGWLPFAIRFAAERAGYYRSATIADSYYTELAQEVNTACDSGKLQCHPAHMVSMMPISGKAIDVALTSNFKVAFAYLLPLHRGGDDVYYPVGAPETPASDTIAHYYKARYTTPMFGALGTARHDIQEGIYKIYAVINPVLACVSLLALIGATILYFRHSVIDWRIVVIAWLVCATLLLRIAMLSYVQTVSFPTIYPIYYAAVYPLLFLFEGVSIGMFVICLLRLRSRTSRHG